LGAAVNVASEFGGNPFDILEDIWFGDNRRNTGWTMQKLRILGYHYEHKAQENERKPKAGGKLFIIQGKNDAFRYSWDKSEELDNG